VADFVEKMVKFRTRFLQAEHGRELAAVQEELHQAISRRETEMRDQVLARQLETSELQSQILGLQYQIKLLSSSASNFRKLRMGMMVFVAMCWLLAPGSIVTTLAATAIAALMFVV
jgi:hypothetical protein